MFEETQRQKSASASKRPAPLPLASNKGRPQAKKVYKKAPGDPVLDALIALRADMNARFDGQNQRMAAQDQRLAAMETKQTAMVTSVNNVGTNVATIKADAKYSAQTSKRAVELSDGQGGCASANAAAMIDLPVIDLFKPGESVKYTGIDVTAEINALYIDFCNGFSTKSAAADFARMFARFMYGNDIFYWMIAHNPGPASKETKR